MNNYIFPFNRIPYGAKIVLYGAGNVGLCFYKQLITTEYASVVRWVDKNWESYVKMDFPVTDIQSILEVEYDYLVIAIEDPTIAGLVKEALFEIGVEEGKIIHFEKCRFADNGLFESVKEEIKKHETEDNGIVQISPKKLLNAKRLDLVVRYLVAKDIKNKVKNNSNLSLYSRMILTRSSAYEGKDYFSDSIREGTSDYINSIKKLCRSMEENGFLMEEYVPIGNNGIILNGAHRTATAIALEEDIWCKFYESRSGNEDFGMDWFERNGFSTDDKLRILRGYADLYEKCGIMILFGTCIEEWSYIQAHMSKYMTVVGRIDLDFTDNYIAFENLLHEVYKDPLWRNVYIDRKIELLKMAPLKIRVILVSDENFKDTDLYTTMNSFKQELRDHMYFNTDIAPVVMHGCDSFEEFLLLKKIILSVNNLKHIGMRVARNYSEELIERMERLKLSLAEKHIDIDQICISGSSGYEIFGLRKSEDIDFIPICRLRSMYGDTTFKWDENIDYVRKNSIKISDSELFEDDLLIEDDNFHFIFNGLKIVNIDLIAAKKKYDNRKKDEKDIRLYELFLDYANNFNNKKFLKQQIEKEFYKKR